MGPDPDNQQDLIVIVDRRYQSVIVAFYVENHSLSRNDAGRAVLLFEFRRILPGSLRGLGVPCV